jgi:hypothetical protein
VERGAKRGLARVYAINKLGNSRWDLEVSWKVLSSHYISPHSLYLVFAWKRVDANALLFVTFTFNKVLLCVEAPMLNSLHHHTHYQLAVVPVTASTVSKQV